MGHLQDLSPRKRPATTKRKGSKSKIKRWGFLSPSQIDDLDSGEDDSSQQSYTKKEEEKETNKMHEVAMKQTKETMNLQPTEQPHERTLVGPNSN